jgi:hypothetical protein
VVDGVSTIAVVDMDGLLLVGVGMIMDGTLESALVEIGKVVIVGRIFVVTVLVGCLGVVLFNSM